MATRPNTPEVIFSTREFAMTHDLSLSGASHHLGVLERRGDIVKVTRGIWVRSNHPHFSPLGSVPFLLGQEQGYVSFLTALHRHGVISQIPATLQVATTGHSRKLFTPFGRFEFFQLKPEMMLAEVKWTETHVPFRMASAEKALIDTLYLATRKGRRFSSLPELHRELDLRKLAKILREQEIPAPVTTYIRQRLNKLVGLPLRRKKG